MSKQALRLLPSRLGLQILLYFLAAIAVSACLYLVLNNYSDNLILSHFSDTEAVQQQTELELEDFRSYVSQNHLSTSDKDIIGKWIFAEKYVLMDIYIDDTLVYSSNIPSYELGLYKYKNNSYMPSYRRLYDVDFADGTAQVGLFLLVASKYYDVTQLFELALAFVCFVLIFFFLISKKVRYIARLQHELNIMESGELAHPVTVKGSDELAFLARDMDQMRLSFVERIKNEKEAQQANSELITSISHDLRTPLTILIGNLDIIADRKYKSEDQLNHYIENSRKKAYQIKELTDRLFEYFLVFGNGNRATELKLMNFRPLFDDLIGEYALSLADQQRKVIVANEVPDCFIRVNLIAVRRVFDNLFINIVKYADPLSAVNVSLGIEEGFLAVRIQNGIAKAAPKVSGTNIGLATCAKIMSQHQGTFSAEIVENVYSATVRFPIVPPPAGIKQNRD